VGKSITLRFEPPGWPAVVGSIIIAVVVSLGWSLGELILLRRRRPDKVWADKAMAEPVKAVSPQ
jgi:hypothetical protein